MTVSELEGGEVIRTPLLDRLVAWAELHLIVGQPLACATLLSLSAMWPAMLCVLPGRQEPAAVVAMLLASSAVLAWVVESSRLLWRARHPYASVRWLHAVRTVAGDDVMTYALARLIPWRARDADHPFTRRDVIDQVGAERRRRHDAAERARGVRIGGPLA